MAKFNKDTFLNDITDKVQSAIDKNLVTKEDVNNGNVERLHSLIQYELLSYIEDRKFAIDVLKDFNYDEKVPWSSLQDTYGVFKSLMDIALVNLWKFLENEGATKFNYYSHDNNQQGKPMLDIVHSMEDIPNGKEDNENPYNGADDFDDFSDDDVNDMPDNSDSSSDETDRFDNFDGFDDMVDTDDSTFAAPKPKRRLRIAR